MGNCWSLNVPQCVWDIFYNNEQSIVSRQFSQTSRETHQETESCTVKWLTMHQVLQQAGLDAHMMEPEHAIDICKDMLADNAATYEYEPEEKVRWTH